MRIAETVTFGSGGLDRAAHLRDRPDEVARLIAAGAARILPLWRGKPLVSGEDALKLSGLPPAHPALALAQDPFVFLGIGDGTPIFAADISRWSPEDVPDTVGAFLDPSEQRHPDLPGTDRFAELRSVMTRLSPRDAELAATAKAILGWHETHGFCSRCGAPSAIVSAGWSRQCPSCGARHFPRTDPVVIMLVTHGNDVLLGRSPGWPPGMFSLLAGFIEPGETVEAAVRREVLEETGVRVGAVDYLASQPWPFPASLMIGCRGVALTTGIEVDPVELEAARWVSREELVTAFAGDHPEIRPARRGAIAHFLLHNWLADRLD